jgi:hypothetical protein
MPLEKSPCITGASIQYDSFLKNSKVRLVAAFEVLEYH